MKEQNRRGIIILMILIIALALAACTSQKATGNIYWTDQYGEQVPIVVTTEGQDTVYNFGTIILYPDTAWVPDTINKIKH